MAEKPPAFTVTDRRKFTTEGDLREDVASSEPAAPAPPPSPAPAAGEFTANAVHPAPGAFAANAVEAAPAAPAPVSGAFTPNAVHPAPGARVVTMPSPAAAPQPPVAPAAVTEPAAPPEDLQEAMEDAADEGDILPEPTAVESAEQHAAYLASSQQLDEMIRQTNPGANTSGPVTIEHVFQSIYFSAVVAMGAAAEPGQKPRIDILGARQSIDMLTALQEKTNGNLDDKEQRLLQTMLFELRMMFLEITNAIAQQAQNPPPIGRK
ncbi:hypothetical protein HNQ77_000379 [Silvibacterium bohemicum]|uniref:DUF1844 domain-containing protein n=1 Tax=Silvibacterium bohemicum TaxID=1577686 RepID=A0A841JTZ2_9BACT|nr:DUF1844 domain-containing protein [Silvibacterium bohemicum]MBB6142441.1 hypothetical protein [Silvibacterium bohemicum]